MATENKLATTIPSKPETLEHLSENAMETLLRFEAGVDTNLRDDIVSLPYETEYDKIWLPVLAMRIYVRRFQERWNSLSFDPRFPNFGKLSRDTALLLAPSDCRPAEAVIEVARRFGPAGYDASWIVERFQEYVRPQYFTITEIKNSEDVRRLHPELHKEIFNAGASEERARNSSPKGMSL